MEPLTQVETAEEVETARFRAERDALSERERKARRQSRRELATKEDLERFYVAMCRKLYDEGL